MEDKSLSKLGGVCAIIVGILYIVAGAAYLMLPEGMKTTADPASYLAGFAQEPTWALTEYWAFAFCGVLGIAVVLAVTAKVRSLNDGWVRWTSTLALIGFSVVALQYSRLVVLNAERAAAYAAGDSTMKAVLAANQSLATLDQFGFLAYGAVGLWFLVVNLLALRGDTWPKILAYLGIVGAIAYEFVVIGQLFEVELFVTIAAGAAVIVGPIWYIWMGTILRK